MNAFEILHVPKTADNQVILNAYLQRVREYPYASDDTA